MHRTFSTKKVPWSYQRVCIVRGTAERAKAWTRTMATDGKKFDSLIVFKTCSTSVLLKNIKHFHAMVVNVRFK